MKKVKELTKDMLFILVIILIFKMIVSVQLEKTDYKTYDYTVQKQDTLWTIASDITLEDANIRNTIIDIKEINELEDATIYVGQTIKLPIYE